MPLKRATREISALPKNSERVHAFSRFFGQDVYISGGKKFWGTWRPPTIPTSPSDAYVTITSAEESRIDLLSYRFYQTPEMWWAIALANQLFFSLEDLAIGTIVRIPAKSTLISMNLIR